MKQNEPLRIAYITQDFPPEMGAGPARVTEMALRWQEAGAEVTVITGMPNRRMPGLPYGEIHPDYRGRFFMEENWRGLRVLRSWLWSSRRRGFLTTVLNNTSWMLTGALHALSRGGRFDVMIASSPPFFVHMAGEAVRAIRRFPMVLEIRDLWPDYMIEMGVVRNRQTARALLGLERLLLRHGAYAVVVTESFRRRLVEKGVPADRIDVISNGVDLDFYRPEAAPPLPLPELQRRTPGEFLVGYLGNFGAGQEIRTVVDAAKQLDGAGSQVRFVLVGDGTKMPEVETHASEAGISNLTIHPPIAKESTRDFYNACDLCLVPLAPVPIFSETVPSKIFEVMACERPVLASVAGEAARIVEGSGGGMVTPPGDAAALAGAIRRFFEMTPARRREMGRAGRCYVTEHYSRDILAARYLDLLRRVAGQHPHSYMNEEIEGL
jgi:colanic acid biosynthesis glycosyl transferase WcaI